MFRSETEITAARLVHVEGMTLREAASSSGHPESTIRMALKRVNQSLRQLNLSKVNPSDLRDILIPIIERAEKELAA